MPQTFRVWIMTAFLRSVRALEAGRFCSLVRKTSSNVLPEGKGKRREQVPGSGAGLVLSSCPLPFLSDVVCAPSPRLGGWLRPTMPLPPGPVQKGCAQPQLRHRGRGKLTRSGLCSPQADSAPLLPVIQTAASEQTGAESERLSPYSYLILVSRFHALPHLRPCACAARRRGRAAPPAAEG